MEYEHYRGIPNAIKQYRKAKGLSQKQLATMMGFKDKTWISHWENGKAIPNLISAIKLSVFLGVPINELFHHLTNRVREEVVKSRYG